MDTVPDHFDWIEESSLATRWSIPYAEPGARDQRPLFARTMHYVTTDRRRRFRVSEIQISPAQAPG